MRTRYGDLVRGVRVRVKGAAAMGEGVLAGTSLMLMMRARGGSAPEGRIRTIETDDRFMLTSGGTMIEAASSGSF